MVVVGERERERERDREVTVSVHGMTITIVDVGSSPLNVPSLHLDDVASFS